MRSINRDFLSELVEDVVGWASDNFHIKPSDVKSYLEPLYRVIEDKCSSPWSNKKKIDFDYSSFEDSSIIVTGVRSDSDVTDDVVITASSTIAGTVSAALYQGSLEGLATADSSDWYILTPEFDGQTVTSSTLYGPNTALFDPDIGDGNVRAVGSYKYDEGSSGPNADHGVIYEGPVDGIGGTWTQIDATDLVEDGDTLLNTIAHSNMGDLVVGNYDTDIATGKAFIYNLEEDEWINLNPIDAKSITAYGIWQNGDSESTSYTIAGGYSSDDFRGLDAGYLVDYDSATDTFENFTTFQFKNKFAGPLISHFDGITGTEDGYNLTGDVVRGRKEAGFFASVERDKDGGFGEAEWTKIAFPGNDVTVTSGNTIVDDTVLGIYVDDNGPNSFFASPSDPHHGCDCWI